MKKKNLILPLLFLSTTLSAQLEMRDASHHPVEGYTESNYVTGKEKRIVYLGSEVLVSSKDIKETYVSKDGDNYVVHITFTDEGAEKLEKVTEQRIRKQLAFIIDGEVLAAPTIMATLSKKAAISGSFSKARAEELAEKILNHNQAGDGNSE